jgi:paraquat-inducible protein A
MVAIHVWVTTIVMPGLDIAAMLYLLLPLRLGLRPPGVVPVFRLLHAARPWGMVEVFILGVLVTLVKLAHLAHAIPGVALAALALLMFAIAAAAASFDGHEFWRRLERLGTAAPGGPRAAGAGTGR